MAALIKLYPPGGGPEETGKVNDSQLEHQLKESGTYKIVVHDNGLDYSYGYTITLSGDICVGGTIYVDDTAIIQDEVGQTPTCIFPMLLLKLLCVWNRLRLKSPRVST